MRIYRLKDCPAADSDFVCRESALLKWVLLLAFLMGAAAIWFAPAKLLWLKILVSSTLAVLALLAIVWLRATFDDQNWLVRLGDAGLRVKFRSYLNRRWPSEDVVVVQLDRREIEFVRAAHERVISHAANNGHNSGTQTESFGYLELKLRDDVDLSELKQRLAEERDRKPPSGRAKFHDVPVRVVDDHIVRITWSSVSRRTTPRLTTAVQRVGALAPIAPLLRFETDLRVTPTGSRQREDLILQLVERGKTIHAIRETRRLYGYPLAEAKQFVDSLAGRCA
jgi:short subunit dehydrogenase-like uncharacterized protein